jgi:uncharacterized protein
MSRTRIIIFAKAPAPGRAKTRLVPALGEAGAARLASKMLSATVGEAVAAGLDCVELCVTPDADHPSWQELLPSADIVVSDQGEGELGERLARASSRALRDGDRVILIGTDCPELTSAHLRGVGLALDAHDAVIHPAQDGGYVLLGLRRFDASLFEGVAWSTAAVARQTLDRIAALGWTVHLGETLRDVDRPEDLAAMGVPT